MKKWLFLIYTFYTGITYGQGFLFNSYSPTYSIDSLDFRFLCRDPKGITYIGTNKGFFIYDGLNANLLVQGDFTCASHNGSKIYLGDATGNLSLAIGTSYQTIQKIPITDSIAISDIAVLGDKVYMGTEGDGLALLKAGEIKRANRLNGTLSDDFVYELASYEGDVWVATDRGVERLTPNLDLKDRFLKTGLTRSLAHNEEELYLSGFSTGIFKYSKADGKIQNMNGIKGVDKILMQNNQLFALESGMLFYLDGEIWKQISHRNDFLDVIPGKHQNLMSLHSDGDIGVVDLSFLYFDLNFKNEISSLHRSENELFAALPGKIARIDLATGKVNDYIPIENEMIVVDMIEMNGFLYCATFNRGLVKVDLETAKTSVVEGLPDQSVLSLFADGDKIWISTLSGLNTLRPGNSTRAIPYDGQVPSIYIFKVLSNNGELWLGTDGKGVFKQDKDRFMQVPLRDAEVGKLSVYDLLSDESGNIYAMSLELGLLELDAETGEFYSTGKFKSDDYVSIGMAKNGCFLKLNESEITVLCGQKEHLYPASYFPSDLSGEYIHTFAEWSDPWLYFASGTGVYGYQSDMPPIDPDFSLISWEVNFENHDPADTYLSSDEQNHVFRFSPSVYHDPENQDFFVRLSGYEQNFRMVQSRQVSFSKLPPGEYNLEIIYGENGVPLTDPKSLLKFSIAQPVFLQWWFIILCMSSVAVGVYLVVKFRINRLNKSRLAEQKLLESELTLLRNQVNPHFLFNSFNTLMNLIEKSPAEANEYLQRLSDFYRRMLEKHNDQVVSLSDELVLAREYCFLQKKRFGQSFNFVERVSNSAKSSSIPVLTLQLLIENAIKHNIISKAKPLEIILEESEGFLCLKNKLAKKREPEAGTGLGLENIKNRYQTLFNSGIRIQEIDGWFEVYLPIIN